MTIEIGSLAQHPTLNGTTIAEWQAIAEGDGVKLAARCERLGDARVAGLRGGNLTNAFSNFIAYTNIAM